MKKQLGFSFILMITLGALVACGGAAPAESPGAGLPPTNTVDAGGGGGGGGAAVDAGSSSSADAGAIPTCDLTSGGQTGSKSCLLLLVGAQSCASLPTAEICPCLQAKFKEGTSEAQSYATSLKECAERSGCGANLQCVLQQCSTEWAACRAH